MKNLYQKIDSTAKYFRRIDEAEDKPKPHYRLKFQNSENAPEKIYSIARQYLDVIKAMELPQQQKQIINQYIETMENKLKSLPVSKTSFPEIPENSRNIVVILSNFHDAILHDFFRMIPRKLKMLYLIDSMARLTVATKYQIDYLITRKHG